MRRNLGGPPRAVFGSLFNVTLGANQAMSVNIISGMTTPVLGANHRYYFYFYAEAQGSTRWVTERWRRQSSYRVEHDCRRRRGNNHTRIG